MLVERCGWEGLCLGFGGLDLISQLYWNCGNNWDIGIVAVVSVVVKGQTKQQGFSLSEVLSCVRQCQSVGLMLCVYHCESDPGIVVENRDIQKQTLPIFSIFLPCRVKCVARLHGSQWGGSCYESSLLQSGRVLYHSRHFGGSHPHGCAQTLPSS